MEQGNEIRRLLNVVYRIGRAAGYLAWVRADEGGAKFCAGQYNRVLGRLVELEPAAAPLFAPLAADAPAEVIRIAARELGAYFEDELPEEFRRHRGCGPDVWAFRTHAHRRHC